ncbi:MAG TPA: glycosyltransferase family 52 [Limnobacter sp.]|uniref:glycosyltransferase family 52 n=1 Tax=Limnobacter sp. TaxID=2003368 RepID=UPI002EDA62B9
MNQHTFTINSAERSLCICLTPLHVLIAQRVAELHGIVFDMGVYASAVNDTRQQHYFNAMRGFCKRTAFELLPPEPTQRGLMKYVGLLQLRRRMVARFARFGRFDVVLSACSISHHLWALLTASRPQRLFTYDDGLLNIQTDARHYRKTTTGRQRLLLRLGGIRYFTERLLTDSLRHFTIYDHANWFARTHRIELLATQQDLLAPAQRTPSQVLKIFVGPSPEQVDEVRPAMLNYCSANPDALVVQHPRLPTSTIPSAAALQSHLVLEDHVQQLLQSDPLLAIEITGVESSALVNLAGLPRVRVFTLLPPTPAHASRLEFLRQFGIQPYART